MATQGPNSPATAVDDATVGTVAWANPTNVFASDGVAASASFGGPATATDYQIKIVKSGTIGTTNKADTVTTWPSTLTYVSYGSSADLWGETWTSSDINNSNFGIAVSVNESTNISHFLIATNFSFTIPTNAQINGILVDIEKDQRNTGPGGSISIAEIDHIRITVTYTTSSLTGIGSITGVQSITL